MSLAERLRGVLNAGTPPLAPRVASAPTGAGAHDTNDSLCRELGGEWQPVDGASNERCFVVERRTGGDRSYGALRVGSVGEGLACAADAAALFTNDAAVRAPFLFFDLETTGLSGGAGTYAFLIGSGWFDASGAFCTRQYVLTRHSEERPLLRAFAGDLTRAGALVSFNGKSFDAPVLETRYSYQRLRWPGASVPHLDLLHPARRFWGDAGGCSLVALEQLQLGARRNGDVPGFEVPARYFQFVRSGNARPLAAVLEHNRLDLLSLAALTMRLFTLTAAGPSATANPSEALALGRTYLRAGLESRAGESFERVLTLARATSRQAHAARCEAEALRSLAMLARRGRRYREAAEWWRLLLEAPGCGSTDARDATEALAIHHEHRERDLRAARAFALRSLDAAAAADRRTPPSWTAAIHHRVARIDRKLTGAGGMSARLELGD